MYLETEVDIMHAGGLWNQLIVYGDASRRMVFLFLMKEVNNVHQRKKAPQPKFSGIKQHNSLKY